MYNYRCPQCGVEEDGMRKIDERHDGPECWHCKRPMDLQNSPVKGYVKGSPYKAPTGGRR